MLTFKTSPLEMMVSLWSNRGLAFSLAKREVIGRYKGSFFGLFWSFFNPLFMLGIYTLVFGFIFKARWTGGSDSQTEFALILFSGLIVFNLFAECISRAPSLILSNTNYVKKVVFPLEILPWVALGSALFHAGVSLLVWFIAYSVLIGVPNITSLMLPVVLLPFLVLVVGLTWLLASLGTFLRDIGQLMGLIVTAMMFLSPIFYPITNLPEAIQPWLNLNPLTIPIGQAREVIMWGKLPDWQLLGIYSGVSSMIAWLGFFCFQKTRRGFADVL
jgi:lipopolysaccharide transport system permease protein